MHIREEGNVNLILTVVYSDSILTSLQYQITLYFKYFHHQIKLYLMVEAKLNCCPNSINSDAYKSIKKINGNA